MSRLFTALQGGVVVRRGTFTDEELLARDLPEPEYTLVLDVHLPFPDRQVGYAEQRRNAYPPAADLADALFWNAQGDSSKMDAYLAACAAVKALYPKVK